jgi:hypothetical protein
MCKSSRRGARVEIGQQPVAGCLNPGYGFRLPISVYLPVSEGLGLRRMNHGINTSSSG